jgi:hypothetical protein
MICEYTSERGFPLVYWGFPPMAGHVVTVENYCKWYTLYLVDTDGHVQAVSWEGLADHAEPDESPWSDHVPNPYCLQRWAAAQNYQIDDQALEMVIGRWEREYRDNYYA